MGSATGSSAAGEALDNSRKTAAGVDKWLADLAELDLDHRLGRYGEMGSMVLPRVTETVALTVDPIRSKQVPLSHLF